MKKTGEFKNTKTPIILSIKDTKRPSPYELCLGRSSKDGSLVYLVYEITGKNNFKPLEIPLEDLAITLSEDELSQSYIRNYEQQRFFRRKYLAGGWNVPSYHEDTCVGQYWVLVSHELILPIGTNIVSI